VRFINVLLSVNLAGDVLDADVVVAVGAAVGWTQAKTTVTDFSSHEIDDLLRASVGRIPDPLRPSERPEQVEIEGERPLNVGHGEIDVKFPSLASSRSRFPQLSGRAASAIRRGVVATPP
jgi:hypothetical protein